MRLFIKFIIIAVSAGILCGCNAEDSKEDISVDELTTELSKDLMERNNDRILEFFSKDVVQEYGEDHIISRLEMAEDIIQGEYISEKVESDGKSGTRGGKGKDIHYYTIELTTDEDKYSVCLSWSNGDSTNGYFSDEYEDSKNLIHLSIFPESTMYDEDGNYDLSLADEINDEDSCICFPEN